MSKDKQSPKLLRVGEAAQAADISRQTLQYYLMVGLIEPAEHTAGGQQLFTEEQVERIRLIKRLNQSGYPLREIREIFLRRQQKKS